MTDPVILAEDLVKEFSRPLRVTGAFGGLRSFLSTRTVRTRAVDGVTLRMEPGELVGYLGPNGAGKSTTVKMLTGVLVPTSGRVEVNGLVPWQHRKANARSIGAVFGQRSQLWLDLPLRDSFDLVSRLYGMERQRYLTLLAEFTELLDLDPFLDTPVRSLSLGQRMRGDLVAAMLYEPPVLYLDEPTVGLDVVAKSRIREFVAHRNTQDGTTVLLTTHDIGDVERLCRRVVIIDDGRVLYDGTLDALRRRFVPYRELAVQAASTPGSWQIDGLTVVAQSSGGRMATLRFDPERLSTPAAISRLTAACEVVDVSVSEPDLESVIHQIYTSRSVAPP